MPNGEILPAGPRYYLDTGAACSNLFDRVSYFSARPRPGEEKSSVRRYAGASSCFIKVLLTSSSRRGGGRETGRGEKKHGTP
jgi:hypothetical protein